MKATPARAALHSAAVLLLCILAMVVSGAIVLSLATAAEEGRRERDYCDNSVRDQDGFLPKACCTADILVDGNCVEAVVCASCLSILHRAPCVSCVLLLLSHWVRTAQHALKENREQLV